ncbi:MAG TPA: hypothetical protein DCL61_17930 [Cyanobacteria bacterium UBA12227]|nr:hypothetical protein [Cyanobacteria bacterium UBA12227]HAX87082.1 hypothetical protein [Cyanobacteria bacterium UBA11370]
MQTEQTLRKQPYEFPESANPIFQGISAYMFWVSIFLFLLGGLESIGAIMISLNQQKWFFVLFWIVELLTYIIIGYFTIRTSNSFKKIVRDQNDSRNLKSALRHLRKLYQIERWCIQLNIVFLVLIPVVNLAIHWIERSPWKQN